MPTVGIKKVVLDKHLGKVYSKNSKISIFSSFQKFFIYFLIFTTFSENLHLPRIV